MIADISSLTWWASFWDTVGVISAAFVFVGVLGESVADFDMLARWARLEPRPDLRKAVAKAGLLTLIAALAVDVVAAMGSHTTNQEIIAVLNTELAQTIEHDIDLTNLTKTLGLSNEALEKEVTGQRALLSSVEGRSKEFEKAIQAQTDRDDAALASLKEEGDRLRVAREDATANAGKAANAAEIANKTAADMTATLNAERAMQEQMRAAVTPRDLSDDQISQLAEALKPFAGTPFDLFVTQDPDSTLLVGRISEALEKAGWDWKPAPSLGDMNWQIPGKPVIAIVNVRGLGVEIAKSEIFAFEKPVVALVNGLAVDGLKMAPSVHEDDQLAPKFDHTLVHIVVGSRD